MVPTVTSMFFKLKRLYRNSLLICPAFRRKRDRADVVSKHLGIVLLTDLRVLLFSLPAFVALCSSFSHSCNAVFSVLLNAHQTIFFCLLSLFLSSRDSFSRVFFLLLSRCVPRYCSKMERKKVFVSRTLTPNLTFSSSLFAPLSRLPRRSTSPLSQEYFKIMSYTLLHKGF